jgi:ABC-2 type transport system ATP-binding protein
LDILSINGVHKRFGDKEVLKGLSFSVPEGSVFGFIGKNGAGKTTAMKAVLGLLKIDAGEIFVGGQRVVYGGGEANRMIGYLPDVPEFYPFMNAEEYLRFCGEISGMDHRSIASRSDELLTLVGLKGEKHRIKGYSRGMKQRLGIASALLGSPKLLICDEPTSALDPIGRKEILDVLSSVKDRTTVMFSTHILSDVERICTDVAFLNGGVLAMGGKLSEIKKNYSDGKYSVELSKASDMDLLLKNVPSAKRIGEAVAEVEGSDKEFFELTRFITDMKLPVLKIERKEPTLEDLFVEEARGL